MTDATTEQFVLPPLKESSGPASDPLTTIIREGACRLLAEAVQSEVEQWIQLHAHLVDRNGHRLVVRNGHAAERSVVIGVGPLHVRMPRVHDRRTGSERERFTSKILPPYLRKASNMEELIPWLYLKGVSTGDFAEALQALVGPECPGLSASTVTRLVAGWQQEHQQWAQRDLSQKEYVYVWADGIHFNIRLEEDRQCILVLMGATADGQKELIAVQDGYRESEQSWSTMLLGLKARGLTMDPRLAIADGALGFWAAAAKAWPKTRAKRCWVHKTANVLDKMPKRIQPHAKDALHQIWMAEKQKDANAAFDLFVKTYEAKYPKAVQCLLKDRDELLAFYDFPAEHWRHLRTTNPIESTFATVRLRHKKTKGNGSRAACLAMVFKLVKSAESKWRRLNGHELIHDVIAGITFTDGIKTRAA